MTFNRIWPRSSSQGRGESIDGCSDRGPSRIKLDLVNILDALARRGIRSFQFNHPDTPPGEKPRLAAQTTSKAAVRPARRARKKSRTGS